MVVIMWMVGAIRARERRALIVTRIVGVVIPIVILRRPPRVVPVIVVVGEIAVDGNNDVVLVGLFNEDSLLGYVDFDPISADPSSRHTSADSWGDMFVAKYDGIDGSYLWSQAYGGASDDGGAGVAIDSTNDMIYVGGFFSGGFSSSTPPPPVSFGAAGTLYGSDNVDRDILLLSLMP